MHKVHLLIKMLHFKWILYCGPWLLLKFSHLVLPWQANHPTPPTGRNLNNKKEPQTTRIQKALSRHSNLSKMKRQRNTQQVKEHEKSPPNLTKEEEIGNLPDKEFWLMIVKMIQNLEKKMELKITVWWRQGLRRCKNV